MPTEEQLIRIRDQITKAEETLASYKEEIQLAVKAGVDMTEARARYDDLKAKIHRMRNTYGG